MHYDYRFPGFRMKALTFSYDDGVVQDRRLLEILAKHDLHGTFNLNGGLFPAEEGKRGRMSRASVAALYNAPGVEVAMHGYTHTHLEVQDTPRVLYEIMADKQSLEDLFGHPISGFAYPFGTYADHVVTALRTAGVRYARTVTSTGRFDMPQDWLRMPATCHHNDPRLFELADRFLALADNEARRDRVPLSLFYLWGHSYEFDDNDNWQVIEQFAAKMSGQADIWYATNGEICNYTRAIAALEITADGRHCYNPTVTPVCFYAGGQPYTALPGETITIG